MKKRLFLIDGNSLINRAFYALPPLTNASGDPTNAVYGLTMMLFRLREDYDPDQILVTFDMSGPTFRHEKYDEYKANRKGMPDDLRPQIPLMKKVLDVLDIAHVEKQGYEADDLIGTISKQGEAEGFEVCIVTGDRDAFQLVSDQTTVLFTKRGITETESINEETLLKEYGVTPGQVLELKGLMGDSSDNIPGVPGVGEKTALKLLASYENIDGVYEHISELKGKLKERLVEFKDQAYLSRDLATIKRDVAIEVDLNKQAEVNYGDVHELFQHLGFKTLLDRLPEISGDKTKYTESWDLSYGQFSTDPDTFWSQLNKASEVYSSASDLHKSLLMAFDDNLWVLTNDEVDHNQGALREALASKKLYCHNGKVILHLLGSAKEEVSVFFDLEVALYCLNPEQRWDFAAIASHFEEASTTLNESELEYEVAFLRLLQTIAPKVQKSLEKDDLLSLYEDIELPLIPLLAMMEYNGIVVDPEKLQEISRDLEETLAKLTEEIYQEAEEEFNINSPKQLGVILFDKLGLPVLKRTKTGPSTSADVLEELSHHKIVQNVLEFRQVAKLKSTYADALGELISPKTKRIHTTFNQTVTATGRLSSTHPNLQNIPVRTAEGRRIREAFVASSNHVLLGADYSQIELRLLAHLSQDETLLKAFRSGQDIHAQTAAEVFGKNIDDVSFEDRNAAKAINFGIVYGISSFGLAKGINLTRAQAQEYIDSYFHRYPGVKTYLDRSVEMGTEKGYVETLFKRRRYLPGLKSRNYAARNFAARTAMNSPIQGSAADIIKLAMLNVDKALKKADLTTKLLLQVHDELVFEVPEKEIETAAEIIRKEMENVVSLDVPLLVEVVHGLNWRDMQAFEFKE
ncbi:MAG: DNA polymerase I [Bacillota bacterium]|nr:DNA polymerase I [Bacillota bacterium]